MKTKNLLNAFVLVCMTLFAIVAQAQSYAEFLTLSSQSGKSQKIEVKPVVDLDEYNVTDFGNVRYYAPKVTIPQKAGSGNVTITFNMQYDHEQFSCGNPSRLILLNENSENNQEVWHFNEDAPFMVSVQPGVYDIIVPFFDLTVFASTHFVIKEQIEVTNDTTISISVDEACNHIHVNNCAPDGGVFKMGLGYEDENGDWIHLEDGNTQTYLRYFHFFNKEFQIDIANNVHIIEPMDFPSPELQNMSHYFDIYVNDVSDRYALFQVHITFSLNYENYFVNYYSINDVNAGTLENDISQYVPIEEDYPYTDYSMTKPGVGYQIGLYSFFNKRAYGSNTFSFSDDIEKFGDVYSVKGYVNLPYQDPNNDNLKTLLQLGFLDYDDIYSLGAPFALVDGVKEHVNFGHPKAIDGGPNAFYYSEIGTSGNTTQWLMDHPAFSYASDKIHGVYNDNCPINAFMVKNYTKKKFVSELSSYYIGRYGELRWGDKPIESQILKFNGEQIDDVESWQSTTLGVYDRTFTNTNVEVDGLPGKSETAIHYDLSLEDNMPPSIEMLHFKNNDGYITDRFASPEDGIMEFTAGDFNYIPNWERFFYYFDCQPIEMTVEYAPYGTEDWNELVVEEVPELFLMPGWGYFYRGSLASVTGQAEKGWFDLKFRLVDEAGNWQEQVVSPAFRIDNLAYSSVANIGDGNAHEVARYSLDGKRVNASHQGVTIIRMSDGTAKKVIQ